MASKGESYWRLFWVFVVLSVVAVIFCIKLYQSDITWVKSLISKTK